MRLLRGSDVPVMPVEVAARGWLAPCGQQEGIRDRRVPEGCVHARIGPRGGRECLSRMDAVAAVDPQETAIEGGVMGGASCDPVGRIEPFSVSGHPPGFDVGGDKQPSAREV